MRKKFSKRILTASLAMTMVMSSAMTAFAAEGSNGSNSGFTPSPSITTTTTETSSPDYEEVVIAPENILASNAVVNIAGTKVHTSIAGVYLTDKVQGAAVVTPLESVKAGLNLGTDQTPYIILYDTDTKKSVLAMASINAALEAFGGNFVTALNIDLGAKRNGKFESLKDGSVNMVIGLPKKCDITKEYSVILVQPGGAVTLLEDMDGNPNTVTFNVKAGLGTYALVQK